MTSIVMARKVQSVPHISKLTPEVMAAQAGDYSMRSWAFSWSKDERCFHMRDGELDLYVRSIEGYTFIRDSDGQAGRLSLVHAMTLDADGNALFRNPEAQDQAQNDAVRQMCFNRREGNWRIWEKETPAHKTNVKSYRGATFLFWPREDTGGHVFATAPMEIVDGVAVFGGA